MACPVCTVVRNVWDRFAEQRARRSERLRHGTNPPPPSTGKPAPPPNPPRAPL